MMHGRVGLETLPRQAVVALSAHDTLCAMLGRGHAFPVVHRGDRAPRRLLAACGRPSSGSEKRFVSHPDTLLAIDNGDAWPTSASRDGRWLAYYGATLGSGDTHEASDPNDVFFLDLTDRSRRRFRLPGEQRGARFSPDGQWVAYESTESGSEQVHIRPWPSLEANYVVSSGGGKEPAWSHDGSTLFFRRSAAMMAVDIAVRDGAIQASAPLALFNGVFSVDPAGDQSYDVTADGRFLMLRPAPGARVTVQVALNWIDEIRARLNRE